MGSTDRRRKSKATRRKFCGNQFPNLPKNNHREEADLPTTTNEVDQSECSFNSSASAKKLKLDLSQNISDSGR